jgi:Na+-transporting NADH:ubiquinone oxidoreductase subunit C
MLSKEALKTLLVAFVLCLVCSVLVSTFAVALKPMQTKNKLLDRNKNILAAAGLYREGMMSARQVEDVFSQFTMKLVNMETGRYATAEELQADEIQLDRYDQRRAAKNPRLSTSLHGDDPAGILRKEKYAQVYVLEKDKQIDLIVLPIHGYGLWGTLYGFVALDGDLNTIKGLGFYEHKETPGLGALVDNPAWRALWPGKSAYSSDGDVAVKVVKGKASTADEVDGLSGATLTTRGVNNLVQFWLGERGFAPFIRHLKAGDV